MKNTTKLLLAAVMVASAIIFFAAAFSTEGNLLKAAVMVASLVFCGLYLQKVTGAPGKYGIVMLRGRNGLQQMKELGDRYPELFRQASDFGLTISFGIPYAFLTFWQSGRKKAFVAHAVLAAAFFYWFSTQPLVTPNSWVNSLLLPASLLLGFVGFGLLTLFSSVLSILASKAAQSVVTPLVPGITVPWEAILSIIIVASVHELAHGVMARIEKIKITSSGVVLWGFIPVAAFVEPDEEKLAKANIWKKRRVLIAGSASNFYFFLIFLVVTIAFSQLLLPQMVASVALSIPANSTLQGVLQQGTVETFNGQRLSLSSQAIGAYQSGKPASMVVDGKNYEVTPIDLVVQGTEEGSPAAGALQEGDTILQAGGQAIYSSEGLRQAIVDAKGGTLQLVVQRSGSRKNISLSLGGQEKIGVRLTQKPAFLLQDIPRSEWAWLYGFALLVGGVLALTAVLSLALAVINVLPIFITDGHRLLQDELAEAFGSRVAAHGSLIVGGFTLLLLLINLARWFKLF